MITIREVSDLNGWRALEPHWDALLQRSRVDCLFLTWDWMDAWLNVYGDGGEWLVLVAEDARDGVVGIAPMMVDSFDKRVPARWIKRLTLLGQKADTASEYLDWIIVAGREDEIARTFCTHLFTTAAHRWDVLEFGIMRADSPTLPTLRSMFGNAWREVQEAPSPFIELPATWEELLSTHSANFRQRIGRFQRKHGTRILLAGRDLSVADGMNTIRELNRERWAERGSSFKSERYLAFHQQIAERMAKQDRLILMLMESQGQIIAGRYDFAYAGKGYNFQGGWRPEWERQSVGKMILGEMVRHCIERGLTEYDFLAGEASYKNEWATGSRGILKAQAWRPGALKGAAWQMLRRVRAMTKSK